MDSVTYIEGFGTRFRIAPGTEIGAAPAANGSLISAHFTRAGVSNGFIKAVASGKPELVAGADGSSGGVERDGASDTVGTWQVLTRGVRCDWPPELKLRVVPPGPWTFEFAPTSDTSDACLFLRGPLRGAHVPAPPNLIAPNQRLIADDMTAAAMWMELEYEHDGTVWRQRHQYAVPEAQTVVLVTAQAPRGHHESLFIAAHAVARSIRLEPPAQRRGFLSRVFGRR